MTAIQYGFLIDLNCCAGCHACTVSCKSQHNVPLGYFRTRVEQLETGIYPNVQRHFIPIMCNQCHEAPCLGACPTNSIVRNELGIVTIVEDTCTGAADCVIACPYEAIYVHPQKLVADKCDFCQDRLREKKNPSCVETCPTNAFIFGNILDSHSEIAKMLVAKSPITLEKEKEPKTYVFYLELKDDIATTLHGVNNERKKESR